MQNQVPSFGDNVRVLPAPETVSRGIAGLTGQVYGFTTPSVTGVSVIGGGGEDFALNISIAEHGSDFWLAAHLVELIDHAPGTTVSIDASPTQSVRNADGTWRVEPKPQLDVKPWWRFW
jgi:hypothetical protein